jgi:hypothetical protein
LVYFIAIRYSLWLFGIYFRFGYVRTKKNLATLPQSASRSPEKNFCGLPFISFSRLTLPSVFKLATTHVHTYVKHRACIWMRCLYVHIPLFARWFSTGNGFSGNVFFCSVVDFQPEMVFPEILFFCSIVDFQPEMFFCSIADFQPEMVFFSLQPE